MTEKFTEAQLKLLGQIAKDGVAYTTTSRTGGCHPSTGYSLERRGYVAFYTWAWNGGNCHYIVFKITDEGRRAYERYCTE